MIEKEFVSYEQALELKALSFDESCFGRWLVITEWEKPTGEVRLQIGSKVEDYSKNQCAAPLYQQAFDWFRTKHNLLSWIYSSNNVEYWYTIIGDGRFVKAHDGEATYEDAKLKCLKQLIKIVKASQEVKTPKKEIEINITITDCESETPETITDKLVDFIEENGWTTAGMVRAIEIPN